MIQSLYNRLRVSFTADCIKIESLGLEVVERRLMDLVPAPAVRLMKSRVKSRPGVDSVQLMTEGRGFHGKESSPLDEIRELG